MARLVPQHPGDATKSSAERRLFDVIARDLPDDWTVLHSLGIAGHRRKPWAEIDFVLIGPPGLFCIEVKGGRVSRDEDGQWRFTNRRDEATVKAEGPWEQVGSASAALRSYLVAADRELEGALIGFGVVMPDITFTQKGPDIDHEILFDERDTPYSFAKFIERVTRHWENRLGATWHGNSRTLSPAKRAKVLHLLRGDFDFRPSLRHRLDQACDELLRLTERQYEILDGLAENERTLIKGGAGTGKTLLAVEEACRQARAGRRVLYLCFNVRLAVQLRTTLRGVPLCPREAHTRLNRGIWSGLRGLTLAFRPMQASPTSARSSFRNWLSRPRWRWMTNPGTTYSSWTRART